MRDYAAAVAAIGLERSSDRSGADRVPSPPTEAPRPSRRAEPD